MDAFRTASPAPSATSGATGATSGSSTAKGDLQPGLYTYKAVKGHALSIDKFELKTFIDSGAYPDMLEDAESLDEWVSAQAKKRGLADTQESYDEITKALFKQIGKSDNEKPYNTFKRLKAAVEATKRLEEAKLPAVLDWKNLKADEIKAISE